MPPERSDSVGSAKPVAPESVPRPDPELLPDSPRLRELELPPPLGWHLRATLMLTSVLSLQTPHRSAPPIKTRKPHPPHLGPARRGCPPLSDRIIVKSDRPVSSENL